MQLNDRLFEDYWESDYDEEYVPVKEDISNLAIAYQKFINLALALGEEYAKYRKIGSEVYGIQDLDLEYIDTGYDDESKNVLCFTYSQAWCSPDDTKFKVPISYLWNIDWKSVEYEKNLEVIRKQYQEREERKIRQSLIEERKKQQEEANERAELARLLAKYPPME